MISLWNIGRIQQRFPGEDGRVRNVQVQTITGNYRRTITKRCVIYPAEGYTLENGGNPIARGNIILVNIEL